MAEPMTNQPVPPSLTAAAPFTDEQVEELVEAGPPAPDEPARFAVTDTGSAEWCMRWVRKLEARRREVEEQAAQWKREVDDWMRPELDAIARQRSIFERPLLEYALARRADDEDLKTLNLPSGKVTTTAKKPRVEVTDDQALGLWLTEVVTPAWLEANGLAMDQLVKWTPKVYVGPLRKLLAIETARHAYDGQELVQRFAVLPVDPSTGEAWSEEVPVEDRVAPGTIVAAASMDASVVPAPVQSR